MKRLRKRHGRSHVAERVIIELVRGTYYVHIDRPAARSYLASTHGEALDLARGMATSGRGIIDRTKGERS